MSELRKALEDAAAAIAKALVIELTQPELGNSSPNHPIAEANTLLDGVVEQAIQGHASTRDAIRWAMQQERERVQVELNELKATQCTSPWQDSPPCSGISRAIETEREACAKVLEGISNSPDIQTYAAAIRARGEK